MSRSSRADVRNPVLALPAVERFKSIDRTALLALAALLLELRGDAAERADKSWRTHKAPMALYWKCVAVYAGHIARALKGIAND